MIESIYGQVKAIVMEWKESNNIENNNYNLPGDWLKIEYFEALNILFRIENSLRVFVYVILKNQYKDKWKELSITSDDAETSTIGAIAKKRPISVMFLIVLYFILQVAS